MRLQDEQAAAVGACGHVALGTHVDHAPMLDGRAACAAALLHKQGQGHAGGGCGRALVELHVVGGHALSHGLAFGLHVGYTLLQLAAFLRKRGAGIALNALDLLHGCGDLGAHRLDLLQLGIDGARLGFAGDSGGAHLGFAATMYLRGEMGGSEFVKCLLLFYGWYGLADSASQRLLGGPWDGLTESEWLWYKDLYAEDVNELQTSPYANLLLNDMTHDMPACYIAAAEFDPLRDDSSALAAICEEHGIPHRYEMFEGVIHAFLHYTRMLDEANDALEHAATFFRQQLGL